MDLIIPFSQHIVTIELKIQQIKKLIDQLFSSLYAVLF